MQMNERTDKLSDIYDIDKQLKKVLKKRRYRHSIGVRYTAICLAMRYGEDLDKASYAGLLHDCAKYMSPAELYQFAKEHDLPVSEYEKDNPGLLHGKCGALLAEKEYGIKDHEILSAITYHTTGRPDMSPLEKIIFTADYIEPGRDEAPELDMLRKTAFTDLDKAVYLISRQTLNYLRETGCVVDPATENTYNYYKKVYLSQNNSVVEEQLS